MKILFHGCCGPCATYPLPDLLKEGHQVYALYFNPNIHPYTEYQKRKQGFDQLASHHGVSVIAEVPYDPATYFQGISFRESQRCRICYQLRMEKAAQTARKGKFDAFTSSLLISPYQDHDLIKEIANNCADKYGISFYYKDWRPYYRETYTLSKELGLYRQSYCGCLYSEWERYRTKNGEG
ncbi:MAG: epoxyqueuosine reductase QueH [Syntrophomonadaceae bacterium]|nr:epoxyqueuosine reductase QueH [Syntrophomonadaceae bacterium]